jgi:hypothetical protein
MKKTIGIILLIIAGLNLISIIGRASSGVPLGSPGYLVILLIMIIGGIALINRSNTKKENTNETNEKGHE